MKDHLKYYFIMVILIFFFVQYVFSKKVQDIETISLNGQRYQNMGQQERLKKEIQEVSSIYYKIYVNFYHLLLNDIFQKQNVKFIKKDMTKDLLKFDIEIQPTTILKYADIFYQFPRFQSYKMSKESKSTVAFLKDEEKVVSLFDTLIMDFIQTMFLQVYQKGAENNILEQEIEKAIGTKEDKNSLLGSIYHRYGIEDKDILEKLLEDQIKNYVYYYTVNSNWNRICDYKMDDKKDQEEILTNGPYKIEFYVLNYFEYKKRDYLKKGICDIE